MPTSTEIYPGVVVDPEIHHGKPVVAGTRVPVALVLGQLAAGVDFTEREREYGITRDQANAALGYASQIVAPHEPLLHDPYARPRYYSDDEWLRHLGMSDEQIRRAEALAAEDDDGGEAGDDGANLETAEGA